MATKIDTTSTIQSETQTEQVVTTPGTTIRLKLHKPKAQRRVNWTENTIDNEYMNKKKSKCCCVYEKPRNWNESSSEDENEDKECRNCIRHRKTDFNKEKSKKDNPPEEQQHDMSI